VFEVVKIRKLGYPFWMDHRVFARRYGWLIPAESRPVSSSFAEAGSKAANAIDREACAILLQRLAETDHLAKLNVQVWLREPTPTPC
jgi:myosin heavy subunit